MLKDELDKYIRLDNNNEDENIENQWQIIKNSIHNAIEKVVGYKKKVCIEWKRSEILNMIEERRLKKYAKETCKNITKYTGTYAAK